VNHAVGAVLPLDLELIQVGEAVGGGAQRRGLVQDSVGPVVLWKSSYSRRTVVRCRWFQIRVRVQ
jgi:hypothetical protein